MAKLISAIIIILFLCTTNSYAAEGVIGEQELFVEGNKWDFKNNENTIIIVGKVRAESPDFILWCKHMTVKYNKTENSSKSGVSNQKLDEVHAKEDVVIDLKNGYLATSNKAHYSKNEQKIILEENATVRSEKNHVSGCMIIYDLRTESYTVESCPDEKAGGSIKKFN